MVSLILTIVLSTQGALAQAPSGGWLLKIRDNKSLLTELPEVTIADTQGRSVVVRPKDNGVPPDALVADGIHSSPVIGASSETLRITVTSGETSWDVECALAQDDPKAEILLELSPDGLAQVYPEAELRRAAPEASDMVSVTAGPGQPEHVSALDPWRGSWLWFVLLGAVGFGAGWARIRLGRRSGGSARLARRGHAVQAQALISLGEEHLEAALAGPLARYRVVSLGRLPPGCEVEATCADLAPTPSELIEAVQELACEEGPPVALLVTDLSRLETETGRRPEDELAAAVGARLPLWVVGGPPHWKRWRPNGGEGQG
jgi:hypothetical protein